jgi:WD40 repeat protein
MSILALSEDMRYVLTGSREGTLKLWVVENGRCLLTFKYSTGVRVIGFSADNQFLFIRDGQGVLHHRKLMAITHPYFARFRLSKVRPPEVALIREDTHNFYLKEARKSLADKDIKQAASLIRWARAQPEHKHGQEAIALWQQLYLYLPRKTLKGTWLLSTWSEHTKAISTCVICTKASFAFTASLDGKIRQWELNNAQPSGSFQEESEPITQLALSGNDRCLLYLSAKTEQQGDILKLYSVDNRHYLTKQKVKGKVTAITLDTNGQYAVLGYITGTLELWDVSIPQGIRLRTFTGNLQDPHTGKWLKDVDKHTCQINAVAFTPDNRYILSADHYGVLKLWEIASGHCLFSVNEHHCPIHTLAMSTNGHFALTGGEDGTVKVWALWKKAQYLKTLSEHKGAITTVVYSKDGHYALSGSRDRTIKLWDIERGFCIHTFKHRSIVQSVALSADGSYVLAGYQCGTLKLWFLDWELADKEPVAWDEAAESFLESFYHQHIPNQGTLPEDRDPTPREIDLALKPHDNTLSSWTEADFKDLLYTLGCSGYGWLKPKGIKERLNEKKEQHRKEIWRARWQATYDLLHIPIPATLIILTMGIFFSTLSTVQLMSTTFLFLAIFMLVIHFIEEDFALFPINKGLFKRPFTWLFLAAFFIVIGY